MIDLADFDLPLGEPPKPDFKYEITSIRGIIDGDTLDVELDPGIDLTIRSRIRLERVNTPETRGLEREAGKYVTKRVQDQLAQVQGVLMLRSHQYSRTGRLHGKYGRIMASIWCDSWCLNQWLLLERLAWPTDYDGSLLVERDLNLLRGIPAELR